MRTRKKSVYDMLMISTFFHFFKMILNARTILFMHIIIPAIYYSEIVLVAF